MTVKNNETMKTSFIGGNCMALIMKHTGLQSAAYGEDAIMYYNEDMLRNNVIIKESIVYDDDGVSFGSYTYISVKHFNEAGADEWELYHYDVLAPIQMYRIITDIFDLYRNNPLTTFIEILDLIVIGGESEAMQKSPIQKSIFRKQMVEEVEFLKAKVAA